MAGNNKKMELSFQDKIRLVASDSVSPGLSFADKIKPVTTQNTIPTGKIDPNSGDVNNILKLPTYESLTKPVKNPLGPAKEFVSGYVGNIKEDITNKDIIKGVSDIFLGIPEMGVEQFKTGYKQVQESMKQGTTGEKLSNLGKGILNEAVGGLSVLFSPVVAGITALGNITGINEATDEIGEYLGGQIGESELLQKFTQKFPNSPEVAGNLINLAMFLAGTRKSKDIKGATKDSLSKAKRVIDATYKEVKTAPSNVVEKVSTVLPKKSQIEIERAAKIAKGFEEQNIRLKSADQAFNKYTVYRQTEGGGKIKITPIDTFSKYNVAPVIEKGSIQMGDWMNDKGELGKLRARYNELDSQIDTKLIDSGKVTKLEDMKNIAIEMIKNNEDFKREATVSKNLQKIESMFEDYKMSYGDSISNTEVNQIRKRMNDPRLFDPERMDADRIIGDVARKIVYDTTPNGEVRNLLLKQGEILSAKKYAEKINGSKVVGGKLNNYALRLIGAGIGSTIKVLPPVIREAVGMAGGEYTARAMQQAQFRSLWTELRAKIAIDDTQRSNKNQPNQSAINIPSNDISKNDTTNKTEKKSTGGKGIIDYLNNIQPGLSIKDVSKGPYKEIGPLSTKILQKLEGRETVSKQFIQDLAKGSDIKQVEKDLINKTLETEGNKVNIAEFAQKVKSELLPLKVNGTNITSKELGAEGSLFNDRELAEMREQGVKVPRYEMVSLPKEVRGEVKDYSEKIYESPIKTSAGGTHFGGQTENYFGHTRVEDMRGGIRRIIEVQSDLYQKGGIEKAKQSAKQLSDKEFEKAMDEAKKKGMSIDEYIDNKVKPLEQYTDPTAHFRMVREEIKQAAKDGKTKLQFPTGETAMKIEGLGETQQFGLLQNGRNDRIIKLTPELLKTGEEIKGNGENWIITDVLGDGKFKAVQKADKYEIKGAGGYDKWLEQQKSRNAEETFDISGKVDTQNPIYKFYESTLGKYLANNFGAKKVTDAQGVEWYEIPINKETAKRPVLAYGFGTGEALISGAVLSTGFLAMLYAMDKYMGDDDEPKMTEEEKAMKEKLGYTNIDDEELNGIREEIKSSKKLRAGFIHSENRGANAQGKNLYEEIGVTGDLGKYQTSPQTLKEWSRPWLGKEYTPDEFRKDPEAQETFMDEFEAVVRRYKLSPEEAAVAWHKGWGAIGFPRMSFEEKKKKLIESIKSNVGEAKEYIKQFLIGYNK